MKEVKQDWKPENSRRDLDYSRVKEKKVLMVLRPAERPHTIRPKTITLQSADACYLSVVATVLLGGYLFCGKAGWIDSL